MCSLRTEIRDVGIAGKLNTVALYRKYRPATFAEVIGQEQVTGPLSAALDSGRINHAYLFSGPRGCGKTSSARILARSLNCVEGPTSTPCGVCNSCRSLAPSGPGNLDVTEMDAASHRGVEDMRALRDRAIYAPADSRYRVFIIDEAHMITNEGFNALLKIVEEPPAHLIFIFATTEPEKVIQTIRSRTHHYPFRLLTPQSMTQLIRTVVAEEGASVEDSVYPLLIEAGGGSPRDTLSVLDQLLAGAGSEGLTYESAVPLLGITDSALLDRTIDALASNNAGALFTTIDDVIEAGHDPRRFAMDLLSRLRDLMILASVPNAFDLGLVTAPSSRHETLRSQAQQFHSQRLAQLATTVNEGLASLRGATSARLLLEVLVGHLLIDATAAPNTHASGRDSAQDSTPGSAPDSARGSVADEWLRQRREKQKLQAAKPAPQTARKPQVAPQPPPEPEPEPAAETTSSPSSEESVEELLHSQWGAIRRDIMTQNRTAGIMLAQAKALALRGDTFIIGHTTGALQQRLNEPHNNQDIVAVVSEYAGRELKVECIIGSDISAFQRPQTGREATDAPEEAERTSSTWGKPAQVGAAPTRPAKPSSWRETMQRATQEAAQRKSRSGTDEVPLPPEPQEPDAAPPEEIPPPAVESEAEATEPPTASPGDFGALSPEEEEEMMANEATQPGESDRRDSLAVAMEMVEQELGARRV